MDRTAVAADYNPTLCNALKCKYPNSRTYKAGPALDGTACAAGPIWRNGTDDNAVIEGTEEDALGYCLAGDCIFSTSYSSRNSMWSEPMRGPCKSACIKRSRGFRTVKRFCRAGCEEGSDVEEWSELCDDDSICGERQRRQEYATKQCEAMTSEEEVRGSPALHVEGDPSQACRIYCKAGSTARWRQMSAADGVSGFFPDGTWCHREAGEDYRCLQGRCQVSRGEKEA